MLNIFVFLVLQYILLNNSGVYTDNQSSPIDATFDAIKDVHAHLDDDHDGNIDTRESADYMEKELNAPNAHRQSSFHNNDAQISVDELWGKWTHSPVYKWSVDDVVHWLKETVKLPKYEKLFRKNKVVGKNMPRLATSKSKYVQQVLSISNAIDRKKIYLRASDLILFGEADVKEEKPEPDVDKNFLAIKAIHSHLDDDRDGDIDVEESVEFLRDELKGSGDMKRHATFHSNDNLISVDDLWNNWQHSKVYNWTNDEVVNWLKDVVGLPEYEKVFRDKNVNGKSIPRLSTDKSTFLQKELGITNVTHRKKIYLRASDIILFGPPEVHRNYFSDTIVLVIVLLSSIICFYSFHQQSLSKKQIEQLTSDMEGLQLAEQTLKELQENNDMDETNTSNELELQLLEEIEEAKKVSQQLQLEQSKHEEEKTKLQLVEQELQELRLALAQAEDEIKCNEIRSPTLLQSWLKVTYRKEIQHFQAKKQLALAQMQEAKDACEKVNKTRRTVLGSLRLAHGQSIDAVDEKILNARSALGEVTKDLQERQHRWQQIEKLCNFNIVNEDGNASSHAQVHRKNTLAKALADNLAFGAKGDLDITTGFHGKFAGLIENEQLDNEVEAITRKAKLDCTSADSSSSQDSIQLKSNSVEQQKPSPPRLVDKGFAMSDSGAPNGSPNVFIHSRNSLTSFDLENMNMPPSFLSDQSYDSGERVFIRANTEPSNLSRVALENRANEAVKNGGSKQTVRTRPFSFGEKRGVFDIGSLQKYDPISLRENLFSSELTEKKECDGDSLNDDEFNLDNNVKAKYDEESLQSVENELQTISDDDAIYKSDEKDSSSSNKSVLHPSNSSTSLSSLKKTHKGIRKLFHRKTKTST